MDGGDALEAAHCMNLHCHRSNHDRPSPQSTASHAAHSFTIIRQQDTLDYAMRLLQVAVSLDTHHARMRSISNRKPNHRKAKLRASSSGSTSLSSLMRCSSCSAAATAQRLLSSCAAAAAAAARRVQARRKVQQNHMLTRANTQPLKTPVAHLLLVGQRLDVLLHAPQQQRPQLALQRLQLLRRARRRRRVAELREERGQAVKVAGLCEVEDREELRA